MVLTFNFIEESLPGQKWQVLFDKTWPFYRQWFLSEGLLTRKGYLSSVKMLEQHMPELMPTYERLTILAGGGDLEARFLSMYCPPPYLSGCSQLVAGGDSPFLIRNYDYNPAYTEGVMLRTHWLKPVIGMSDCNWGLLDGMNGDGLAATLAFGGRKISGEGFGIPLVIRYLLETASTVKEAIEKLITIPIHMVYNITLADAGGDYATVYVSPDREPVITRLAMATNHQGSIEWPQYVKLTASEQRNDFLQIIHNNPAETEETITWKFLQPPLFTYHYERNFGTLYTVNYRMYNRQVLLHWPGNRTMIQSFDQYWEGLITVHLPMGNKIRQLF